MSQLHPLSATNCDIVGKGHVEIRHDTVLQVGMKPLMYGNHGSGKGDVAVGTGITAVRWVVHDHLAEAKVMIAVRNVRLKDLIN
jgi:hypothetical protein